jgi:menaquinone-9 beta-reductase
MSTTIDTDVLVVGGGVAGATTARLLAEAGYQVIILDRALFPRDKPCGEGVMPTGVRLLDRMGVLAQIPPEQRHPLRGVGFVVRGRDRVQGDFPDVGGGFDQGIGIKRQVLDFQVLQHARAQPGVAVHESEPAMDATWRSGSLAEVSTPSARYRARVVVGADGIHSLIRRRLGLELRRGRRLRYGLGAHFAYRDGRALGDYVTVYLEKDAECYITPVSNTELDVTLLVERVGMKSFAGRLGAAYDAYLQAVPHLRTLLTGGQRISNVQACGPFDIWAMSRVADRAVLVGDAGGYLDPVTGEGISLALQSAHWAAAIVDEALRRDDLSAARLQPYQAQVEAALRHYKWLTRAVLRLIRHERLAAFIVRRLARCPELYTTLLAINCGVRTFWDIGLADLCRFVLGQPTLSNHVVENGNAAYHLPIPLTATPADHAPSEL